MNARSFKATTPYMFRCIATEHQLHWRRQRYQRDWAHTTELLAPWNGPASLTTPTSCLKARRDTHSTDLTTRQLSQQNATLVTERAANISRLLRCNHEPRVELTSDALNFQREWTHRHSKATRTARRCARNPLPLSAPLWASRSPTPPRCPPSADAPVRLDFVRRIPTWRCGKPLVVIDYRWTQERLQLGDARVLVQALLRWATRPPASPEEPPHTYRRPLPHDRHGCTAAGWSCSTPADSRRGESCRSAPFGPGLVR
jgi:hypothetical protein